MYLRKMVLDPSTFKAWNKDKKKPANELKILQILRDEVMNFILARLLAMTIRNVASSD